MHPYLYAWPSAVASTPWPSVSHFDRRSRTTLDNTTRCRAGLRCCSFFPNHVSRCSVCSQSTPSPHTHTHTHRAHPVRLPCALRRSSGTDPIPHPCEIVVLYQKRHYHHRGLLYRSHCKPGLQSITISPGGVTSLSSLSSADHLCRI